MDRKLAGATGIIGAVVLTGALIFGDSPDALPQKTSVPVNASHLWAKQSDGGTGLRDPLPTLDDGGCQAWAERCPDGFCARICQ
jgi:hypothetical protein